MQHTLAFAPTAEDLQDFYFDLPVISLAPGPEADPDETPQPEAEAAPAP